MLNRFAGPDDRAQYPEPDDVANAIRKAIEELVQLNQDHPFSYDRDELIRMLDEAMAGGR